MTTQLRTSGTTGRIRKISAIILGIYIFSVIILCLMSFEDMPQATMIWAGIPADKIAHCLMFLPYPPLAWLTFRGKTTLSAKLTMAMILAVGCIFAIATEWMQSFTESRECDPFDMLADIIGIVAGTVAVLSFHLYNIKELKRDR